MASQNPNFEENINYDVLIIILNQLSLKEMIKLMRVNRRWKDGCLYRLRTTTKLKVEYVVGYLSDQNAE